MKRKYSDREIIEKIKKGYSTKDLRNDGVGMGLIRKLYMPTLEKIRPAKKKEFKW